MTVDDLTPVADALTRGASELSSALGDEHDVVDRTLRATVRSAVMIVPGVEHVGFALCAKGSLEFRSTGDDVADELDAAQSSFGEGPSVRAAATGRPVDVPDLAADPHLGVLARAAARHGLGAAYARVLSVGDEVVGVLTLYAREALDDRSRALVGALAAQATVALFGAQRIAGLARAVQSRDLIGQAKGILVERDGVDADEAFSRLVGASQSTNLKLVDVARWLVTERVEQRPAPIDRLGP
ncbi:GAF and ANTAR domain-containing protein [Actinomycetospora atypica]|uniref:GAF and ANTAR domain-containing protein n=1 Tax=Actinomycetospora atypica TaxID=1290095 RepID=A0ABV9YJ56_9PSEU